MPDGSLQKRTVLENQRLDKQIVASTNELKTLPILATEETSKSEKLVPVKVTEDAPVDGPLVRPPTELATGAS